MVTRIAGANFRNGDIAELVTVLFSADVSEGAVLYY